MRIGFQALQIRTADDFRRAGVARAAIHTLEGFLDYAPEEQYVIFTAPGLQAPERWRRPNVKISPLWPKVRSWNLVGRELEPLKHKLDVYFSIGGVVPRLKTCARASIIFDLFFLSHPELYTAEDRAIHTAVAERITRNADLIFAISEHTKSEILRFYPHRKPESIVVDLLGPGNLMPRVDAAELNRSDLASYGVPFDRYILTVSTLEPRKNVARLLEAWAQVCQEPDFEGVGLCIAGGKGWLADPIFESVERLGIRDRVAFLGYVPDDAIPPLYAGAEFFVLASLVEGFGLPVLEALHYGVPVVCSNGGSLPEVGGELVEYFDPTNVEAMADGLRRRIRVPDRTGLIAKGRERAAAFTWQAHTETCLNALRKLVG